MKEEICDLSKIANGDTVGTATHKDAPLKYHALMLFENCGGKYIHTCNQIFTDGAMALLAYAETPCPASQLVSAETKEELREEMDLMIKNMKDDKWVEKNIDPYV